MHSGAAQHSSGRRRSVSRERLLESALTLFMERGFAATRVEDIAQRAGVSKGCIYLYFKTKDEIFQAVIEDGVVAHIDKAEQFIADFGGSANDLLTAMLTRNLLEFWGSPSSGIPKLVLAESQIFPDLAARYFDRITIRARRLLENILQAGIDSGEYRPIDVQYVARCILNALDHELITLHAAGTAESKDLDPARFVTTILDLIRHGINQSADGTAAKSSRIRQQKQLP